MSREQTRDKLIKLVEPLLEEMGFELVRLDYAAGKHGKVSIFIDSEDGININNCEEASKAVSDLLDLYDPISHSYTLEVSSPGIERPLTKKEHFIRYQGNKVKVKTTSPLDESRKFSGLLQNAGKEAIEVRKENGSSVKIPYEIIDRANLWYTEPEKEKGLNAREKGGAKKRDE